MGPLFARILFCGLPALIAGVVGFIIHPAIGALFGTCMFGFGWNVTSIPKKRSQAERQGEGKRG